MTSGLFSPGSFSLKEASYHEGSKKPLERVSFWKKNQGLLLTIGEEGKLFINSYMS